MSQGNDFLKVTYRIAADNYADAKNLARKIVIEQSVETPEAILTPAIEASYVGEISRIDPVQDGSGYYDIEIAYGDKTVGDHLPQLINVIWGNVSMYAGVKLQDLELSAECVQQYVGPRYGVKGIRERLGVYGRPLFSTALKPRGTSNDDFAEMAYQFALAGGDIIKDDQNLVSDFDDFRERTAKCSAAVARANMETGYQCLYFPFIAAPFEQLASYFDWIKQLGIRGVLICPLITGLDCARALAQKYDLIYMAHPAFTGGFSGQGLNGVHPALLYGTLYRLAGVDISVFVNPNTRFPTRREDGLLIAQRAREPLGQMQAMFPCPAGGLQKNQIASVCSEYGEDSVLLIGGSLLSEKMSLREATESYLQTIYQQYPNWNRRPVSNGAESACEIPDNVNLTEIRTRLQQQEYRWQHRPVSEYKDTTFEDSFSAVKRIELIGKSGEQVSFELRYFEVEAGGCTSLERHAHTHLVIGVRGTGIVRIDEQAHALNYLDIVYVRPNSIHQLVNQGTEPFGFFCLVDRERDRPVSIDS